MTYKYKSIDELKKECEKVEEKIILKSSPSIRKTEDGLMITGLAMPNHHFDDAMLALACIPPVYFPRTKKLEKMWFNPKKNLITTKNSKDEVIKVAPGEGDSFDPYIGAALAYCYQQFGSKAKFKKAVEQLVGKDVIKTYRDNMKPTISIHCADNTVFEFKGTDSIIVENPGINLANEEEPTYKVVKQAQYQKGDLVEIYTYAELDESILSGLTAYEHSVITLYGGQRKTIGMACPDINTYFFKNGTNTISDDIIKGKIIKGKVVLNNDQNRKI
jgi:hypothetical protein